MNRKYDECEFEIEPLKYPFDNMMLRIRARKKFYSEVDVDKEFVDDKTIEEIKEQLSIEINERIKEEYYPGEQQELVLNEKELEIVYHAVHRYALDNMASSENLKPRDYNDTNNVIHRIDKIMYTRRRDKYKGKIINET